MPGISSGIRGDANLLNLREIPVANIRPELTMFLIPGENITQAFQTIRDQVVFTNKRLIVANVQGITGKKVSYTSYPFQTAHTCSSTLLRTWTSSEYARTSRRWYCDFFEITLH